ncbi:T9SS type A sorting domain-containing protein [Aureisphaera galaxeae]|uniref:T9SS type A sorting domain-containing protein n=1 Tax=Aureisphaera galaxeae TaxID=1538023 RepID=UPI002350F71C|nr:T9SS type A sorting domain-containing protein [Aureisphaera galaxeae]MDC8003179.1 T9SS type A sorting domain-containing protein [Aureisphaera galaxeae]
MKTLRLFIIVLMVPLLSVLAQERTEDKPVSWELNLQEVEPIELPTIDLEAVYEEDSVNDLDKSLPWRYGIERPIIVNLQTDGEWTDLSNGDRIWRAAIKSPEAINMSVNFNDFLLPNGGRLVFYNFDRTDISKTYSHRHNRDSKKLGSWYIDGDTIYIEYNQLAGTPDIVELEIGSIIHGYRLGQVDDLIEGMGNRGLNDSGACNYDVNCPVGDDFDDKKELLKKTVALLNLGNGYLCSASLMNNTRVDKTPYLLTGNHCLENSDPNFWSVRFNWVSPIPVCAEDTGSVDVQTNFTMSGAELRANNAESDFALVELVSEIPASWDVAFAGWDRSDNIPEFQVGIHHPNGDIMKICRDDDPAMKENANGTEVWLIKGVSAGNGNGWELGTTESGSSGSPLFDQEGRVIGQLYAGQSFCDGTENNGDYDIYGRFAVSWDNGTTPETRLMDWLDPIGTGQFTLESHSNALSTPDFEATGILRVYPNPATTYVSIMNTRYPNLSYRLYNLVGQQIFSGNASSSENRIDVSALQEGIYFLHLVDENSQNDITKKIIVEN